MTRSPIIALHGQPYAQAAALGCLVELHLRLAIDTEALPTPEAYEPSVNAVLATFCSKFGAEMSPDDRGFLEKVLTLRHKIVHCDFQAARRVLSELGIVIAGGSVWKGDLTSGDNSQVTDLTKRQGRNIGWFLEAGSSGLFARAAETFKRALQLIDRLG